MAKGLKLDADLPSLMPDGVLSVDNLQRVIDKTGGYSSAMVIVESPDPNAAVRYLDDLREEVLKLDWVVSAEYSEDTSVFDRNRLLYLSQKDLEELDRQLAARLDFEKKNLKFNVGKLSVELRVRDSPTTPPDFEFEKIQEELDNGRTDGENKRIFRSEDKELTIMVVFPRGSTTDVGYARNIVRELEHLISASNPGSYHPGMDVEIGGRVSNLVVKLDAIINDITGVGVWSIVGIFLVLILYCRRVMTVVYIGLPLIVGFLMAFALTQLVLGHLNLITVFLVLILFGLGIDFGIHNFVRYEEVRKSGGDMRTALETIYSKTGHASLLAGITTVAGFYALMLTNFRAFSEFGFIAGSGVVLTLVSMYVFFPALMVFAERIGLYRVKGIAELPERGDAKPFPWPRTILATGLVSFVACAGFAFDIEFESDFSNLKTELPELSITGKKIERVFPLRSDKAVVFVAELKDVAPLVEEIERIRISRPVNERTIEKVRSIYSVVPETTDQIERLKTIDRIQKHLVESKRILEDFSEPADPRKQDIEETLEHFGVTMLTPDDLPPALQRTYMGIPGSGGYLVYIFNREGMSNLKNAQAFVDDVRAIEANGKTFHPATEAMVFVDMLNLMKKDARLAVAVGLSMVFITLMIAYRDLRITLLILVPVIVGVVWMMGLMGALGIRLNIFNMVVLPTVIGIGIDNAIHIFHRYREERGRLVHVIRTTGGAAFLTTLTTLMAFAGTLSASNQGLQSLGLLACLGLGCCMVSSLTVFPAALQLISDNAGSRKDG